MVWWEVLGWVGSLLVVLSLTQARVLRFRWINLAGAVIATAYNAVFAIWPFVVMNLAIAVIDVYWLWRLLRERHDPAVYEVVEVAPDDAYLRHVMAIHATDIAQFRAPAPAADADGRLAFLVARGDEAVGVVLVQDVGDGVGHVELDWVTPRFRDFTPGEFVYRRSGVFADHGFHRLVTPGRPEQEEYLTRVGFAREDGAWVRAVAQVAELSAGLVLYRRSGSDEPAPPAGGMPGAPAPPRGAHHEPAPPAVEVLCGHMGGPFWARKDERAWSFPKGLVEAGEGELDAALREFAEEVGGSAPPADYRRLGEYRYSSGKVVVLFAGELASGLALAFDPARGATFELEWPPRSGRRQVFPELDRVEWFEVATACGKLVAGQAPALDDLERLLAEE